MAQSKGQQHSYGIVVGVDGSDNSAHAARWAAREAVLREVPLTLVHALHLPTSGASLVHEEPLYVERGRAEGHALLNSVAETLQAEFSGLVVDTQLSDLAPASALSAFGVQSDLLVTGTRGRGGFEGMLLGSVTHGLAAHGDCPVTVVRGQEPTDVLNEVVVGISEDPVESRSALAYAFAAAQRHGASLRAVRAWQPSEGPGTVDSAENREQEQHAIEDMLAPFGAKFSDVSVRITVEQGNPVPILIEAVRRTRLLVIGAHRRHGPFSVGAGYVIDGVLAHSPTPVAVVPAR